MSRLQKGLNKTYEVEFITPGHDTIWTRLEVIAPNPIAAARKAQHIRKGDYANRTQDIGDITLKARGFI